MGVLFSQGILNSRPGTLRPSSEATLLLYILFHLLLVSYILDSPTCLLSVNTSNESNKNIELKVYTKKKCQAPHSQGRCLEHILSRCVPEMRRLKGATSRCSSRLQTVLVSAPPPLFTPVANKTLSVSRECSLRSRFPFESRQIATWVKLAAFYLFPCPTCAAAAEQSADILLLNSCGNGAEYLN